MFNLTSWNYKKRSPTTLASSNVLFIAFLEYLLASSPIDYKCSKLRNLYLTSLQGHSPILEPWFILALLVKGTLLLPQQVQTISHCRTGAGTTGCSWTSLIRSSARLILAFPSRGLSMRTRRWRLKRSLVRR